MQIKYSASVMNPGAVHHIMQARKRREIANRCYPVKFRIQTQTETKAKELAAYRVTPIVQEQLTNF